jgi:TPR repeat protein
MENKDASLIYGNTSHAPYINDVLLTLGARATNFRDELPHLDSEPHYLWMEAGTNVFPDHTFESNENPSESNSTGSTAHLSAQLAAANKSWMTYQESAPPGICPINNSGLYAARHNPFVFFRDVSGDPPSESSAECIAHTKPYSALADDLAANDVADYVFITPNICADMHGNPACPDYVAGLANTEAELNNIRPGDGWLKAELPRLLAWANAHSGVILITWDEDSSGDVSRKEAIPFLAFGTGVKPGYAGAFYYDHGSIVKTIEKVFGLPILPAVLGKNDLSDLFEHGVISPNEGESPGEIAALVRLGDLFLEGTSVRRDMGKALSYYGRAVDGGSQVAKVRFGEMLARGQGVVQDIDQGRAFVREVADTDNKDALVSLGDLYSRGDAGPIDPQAAIGAYERAALLGDPTGLTRLGTLYLEGRAVAPDPAKAADYFRQAAAAGSAPAKLRLGEMLARGRGVARDLDQGRALVREVAATGDTYALILLGDLYSGGDAGPVDGAAAAEAYEKAASLGSEEALARLGDLYYDGKAAQPDLVKALGYYRDAAEAGSQTATVRLGEMLIRGLGQPADVARGLAMLSELADSNDVLALVALGDIYAHGYADRIDAKAAIEAYEKAAVLGDSAALMRLGDTYYYGLLTPADGRKALEYYQRAVEAGNPYAQFSIGRGYLERGFGRSVGSPAEGVELLKQAERAGVEYAAVALSDAHLYGKGVGRDVKLALSLLVDAMQGGNLVAARQLIDIYRVGRRDGRVRLVAGNLGQARSYLQKIEGQLDLGSLALETLLLDSSPKQKPSYSNLYDRLQRLSPDHKSEGLRELRAANPNAYIFYAQTQLKRVALYRGKSTGQLDQATIRAINGYCDLKGAREICRFGPMSGRTADVLSTAEAITTQAPEKIAKPAPAAATKLVVAKDAVRHPLGDRASSSAKGTKLQQAGEARKPVRQTRGKSSKEKPVSAASSQSASPEAAPKLLPPALLPTRPLRVGP